MSLLISIGSLDLGLESRFDHIPEKATKWINLLNDGVLLICVLLCSGDDVTAAQCDDEG